MIQETCSDCGATFSGHDRAALIGAAFDHYSSVHPQWGLSRVAVENYFDAKERLSDDTQRLETIGEIEVHKVTRQRVDDLLEFFDRDAFAGLPEWAACYCMFYHRDEPQLNGNNPWQKNRADIQDRLRAGTTTGYLAYVDGKPAGWCNASVRSAYPVRRTGEQDDEVGVVACFVIAPPYRRHGLSRRLLDAAIDGFQQMGVKRVQAHPRKGVQEDAGNYHGPLPLYIDAGFEVAEEDERSALVVKEL